MPWKTLSHLRFAWEKHWNWQCSFRVKFVRTGVLNAIVEGKNRDTGWLSCTCRAVLKLYFFWFFLISQLLTSSDSSALSSLPEKIWILIWIALWTLLWGAMQWWKTGFECIWQESETGQTLQARFSCLSFLLLQLEQVWSCLIPCPAAATRGGRRGQLAEHTDHLWSAGDTRQLLCITAALLRKGSHNNDSWVLILLPASTAWPLHVVLPVRKGWACWTELPLEFPWAWTCDYTSKTLHPCVLVRVFCSCLTQPHRTEESDKMHRVATHTGQMKFLWIVIEFHFSPRGFHIYFHQSHGCEWWASMQGAWLAPLALPNYINGIYLEPSSHGHKLNWIPGGSNLQKERNVKDHL